jgi:hypothetical protein
LSLLPVPPVQQQLRDDRQVLFLHVPLVPLTLVMKPLVVPTPMLYMPNMLSIS